MPSTSPSTGARRRATAPLVALLGLGLTLSTTLVAPASAERAAERAAPRSADKPWSGFRTAPGRTAAAGFLGARRTQGMVVYRIDPGARPSTKGYRPGAYVDVLDGTGRAAPGLRQTQRAAWIVSKYGGVRDDVQNAAVELSLHDLLVGGRWGLGGKATRARLTRVRERGDIVRFAREMLAGSVDRASDYTVTLTPEAGRSVGQSVTVRLAVTATATGLGVPFLPTAISYGGVASPPELETDANGVATATFPAPAAGPIPVTATVQKIPETRLLVREPKTKKASRLVVAAIKTTGGASATAAVRAVPRISLTASYGARPSPYSTRGQLFGQAAGYASRRTATATLHGPYATEAAARFPVCGTGGSVGTGRVAVAGNSSYALPTITLPTKGWYRWSVSVPADAYNNAAIACGGLQNRAE